MSSVARILLSGLIGAVVCAVLGFLMFFVLTIFDNTRFVEAFAYSLVVAVLCAVIGVIIGLVIGWGNLGVTGGGIVGVLLTAGVVAIYVFSMGSPGRYGYFLSQSRVILVVLALPVVLTGIITALFKNLLRRP